MFIAASTPVAQGTLLYGVELAHNDGPWTNPQNFRKASGVLRYSVGPADDGYSVTAIAYQSGTRPTRFRCAPWRAGSSTGSVRSTPPMAVKAHATVFPST